MSNLFNNQRLLTSQEIERLAAAIDGTYVFPSTAGGAVTANSGLTLNVAAITGSTVTIAGAVISTAYAGGTVTHDAADATNPRRDYIYYNTSGSVGIKKGTAAAKPVLPDLASTEIAVAEIYIAANDTTISGASEIIDKRQSRSGDFTWIRKAATETVNGSNTLQNDDEFTFTVTASMDYLVECALAITTGTTPDWKFAWTLTNMTWDGTYEDAIGFGSTPTLISTQAITSGTGRAVTAAAAATSILWRATFLIHAGSTGGTLNFQWAQNTSDASNTSVLKNSWMRYRLLGAT